MKKFLFLIIFCVGIFSCSFAIDANVNYMIYEDNGASPVGQYLSKYSSSAINVILSNYSSDSSNLDYITALNSLISAINEEGFKYVLFFNNTNSKYYLILARPEYNIEFIDYDKYISLFYSDNFSDNTIIGALYGVDSKGYRYLALGDQTYNATGHRTPYTSPRLNIQYNSIISSNADIYTVTTSSSGFYWDGVSYTYQAPAEIVLPGMENPFSNKELIELSNKLNNSSVLKDYLPNDYTDYFITYHKGTGQYKAYFYPSSIRSYARVYPDNFTFDDGTIYDYYSYRIGMGTEYAFNNKNYSAFFNIADKFNVYTFVTFDSSSDFWHFETVTNDKLYERLLNLEEQPVVFTSKDFNLYYVNSEGDIQYDTDNESFVTDVGEVGKTDLVNEETGESIVTTPTIDDKDDNSIWSVINNLPQRFLEILQSIFVPDISELQKVLNLVNEKLPIINESKFIIDKTIEIISEEVVEPPQLTMDLSLAESDIDYGGEAVVLDFSWYAPYKGVVDVVIIGFVYIVFFWRLFYRIPSILAGSDSIFSMFMSGTSSTNDKGGRIR